MGLSYSVMVTQRFLVPHFLVRVQVGQLNFKKGPFNEGPF